MLNSRSSKWKERLLEHQVRDLKKKPKDSNKRFTKLSKN
jgi:hypothetical protein